MALEPITAGLDLAGKVADLVGRFIPDPTKQAEAALAIQQLAAQERSAQVDVNKAEAANSNMFVAGWRPFIGWVCGSACAWNWIGLKMALFVAALFGSQLSLQPANLEEMMPVLLGLLGLGGLRTYEKVQGVPNSTPLPARRA
jgi:hypothetical protein